MDGRAFLHCEFLQFPKDRKKDDLLEYMKELFDEFEHRIAKVEGDDRLSLEIVRTRDRSKELCKSVLAAVQAHFDGKPHEAYKRIDESLAGLTDVLD